MHGQPAPVVHLRNQYGETVELSRLSGAPVLVMFYPFAFSRVCTSEVEAVVSAWPQLCAIPAEVLAVSCDSVHTLRAFAAEHAVPDGLHLLSDFWPHGATARSFGVFNTTTGAPLRTSFLLDAEHRIRHIIAAELRQARSLPETIAQLERLAAEITPEMDEFR